MAHLTSFNNEMARTILVDILKTVTQPENAKKLAEAKSQSGKEMIKMMQFVFPLVMEIEMGVLKSYGFPPSREGLIQFAQLIREIEKDDVEVCNLRSQIRSIYMPPISMSQSNDILI